MYTGSRRDKEESGVGETSEKVKFFPFSIRSFRRIAKGSTISRKKESFFCEK